MEPQRSGIRKRSSLKSRHDDGADDERSGIEDPPESDPSDWERELEDQKKNTLPAPTVPGITEGDEADDIVVATQAATLSGIQIKAANEIVAQIYSGALTREAGIQQLMIFLGLTKEQAEAVIGAVEQGGK